MPCTLLGPQIRGLDLSTPVLGGQPPDLGPHGPNDPILGSNGAQKGGQKSPFLDPLLDHFMTIIIIDGTTSSSIILLKHPLRHLGVLRGWIYTPLREGSI